MASIRVIAPEAAEGELKAVYDEAKRRRGAVANVLRIHSLQPKTLQTHMDFYLSILYGPSGLSRQEREAIAVAVSHANDCGYCIEHHADAFSRYQKEAAVVQDMKRDGRSAANTAREKALLDFAVQLTRDPKPGKPERVQALRQAGFTDEEILMATLTVGYFNFVNRVVLALDVELEDNVKGPYKY